MIVCIQFLHYLLYNTKDYLYFLGAKRMQKFMTKQKFLLAFACLIALNLTACGNDNQAGMGGMPPAAVDFTIVGTQDVPVISNLIGRTTAIRSAEVRPQVSGVILKRMFTEGSVVTEGQQLYQIDPAIYEAQLSSANANLAQAKANLYSAELRFTRYSKLLNTNAISKQDYDDAEAAFKVAEATVLSAKASVKTAEINLGYTKVYAPITGTIGRSTVTEGALVTNNQAQELATIQQLDPIYVDLGQSVSDHLKLKRNIKNGTFSPNKNNQQVELFFEDGSSYEHKGKLEFSEVNVDQSTGMLAVRVNIPNPDHVLLPGMYIKAAINEGIQKNATVIPQISVLRQTNGTSIVYVVQKEGCAPGFNACVGMKTIETSGEIGDKYIIKSGIEPGDLVITSNVQKIGPGAPITPIDSAKPKEQKQAK